MRVGGLQLEARARDPSAPVPGRVSSTEITTLLLSTLCATTAGVRAAAVRAAAVRAAGVRATLRSVAMAAVYSYGFGETMSEVPPAPTRNCSRSGQLVPVRRAQLSAWATVVATTSAGDVVQVVGGVVDEVLGQRRHGEPRAVAAAAGALPGRRAAPRSNASATDAAAAASSADHGAGPARCTARSTAVASWSQFANSGSSSLEHQAEPSVEDAEHVAHVAPRTRAPTRCRRRAAPRDIRRASTRAPGRGVRAQHRAGRPRVERRRCRSRTRGRGARAPRSSLWCRG